MKEFSGKQSFQKREWIPQGEYDDAIVFYKRCYDDLKALSDTNSQHYKDTLIDYNAIEIFCTDPELEKFWALLDRPNYHGAMVMSRFSAMSSGFRLSPRITEKKRDITLKEIDDTLAKLVRLATSDNSVHDIVMAGLLDTSAELFTKMAEANMDDYKKTGWMSYPPLATLPTLFFQELRENIKKCDQNTHARSAKNAINNNKIAERVFFMNKVSELVRAAYCGRKQNHTLSALILNKIRPDLGNFTAENLGQVVGKLEKPKSLQKKSNS